MSEEKVYTFNEYVLGYDSGRDNDRSCLTISKILNDNMYVMSTLYDGSAEVIITMLDSLQQKVEQLEKENKELKRNCNIGNEDLTFYRDKYKQLENIRKEAIEYIENNSYFESNIVKAMVLGDYSNGLLNILNKGSDKEW